MKSFSIHLCCFHNINTKTIKTVHKITDPTNKATKMLNKILTNLYPEEMRIGRQIESIPGILG